MRGAGCVAGIRIRARSEGIIGKPLEAPYRSGRSDRGITLKCDKLWRLIAGGIMEKLRRKGAACARRESERAQEGSNQRRMYQK
ncbi:hypothetical protein DIE06_32755 [Burkholderia sp. Bp8998]|nr:hypothetical protein DIE06_32755 [Burkholderia sp. Bp8998]